MAHRIDAIWEEWERPDPFFIVEAGAGRGRLAQSILNSGPRCADALRYVLVERSAELREQMNDRLVLDPPMSVLAHDGDDLVSPGPGPRSIAIDTLPRGLPNAVVLANELVDNLVFDIEEEAEGEWHEVLVGKEGGEFVEVRTAPSGNSSEVPRPDPRRRPSVIGWKRWMVDMQAVAPTLSLLLFDYGGTLAEIVERSPGWLRTYRAQREGSAYFRLPGSQDVTTDVPFDRLVHDLEQSRFSQVAVTKQAEWLTQWGITDEVDAARSSLPELLDPGNVEQLRARSTLNEAAALTDPTGLGSFFVLEANRG